MRYPGTIILFSAIAWVGMSFVHPFGDPRVVVAKEPGTLLRDAHIPGEAKAVLAAKCADCHSNETRWPVYARIAPGSWLIERDIIEGRRKMNLSEWDQIPVDTQDALIAKIISEAKSGEMPPTQYRAIHWGAKLMPVDVAALSLMSKTGPGEASLGGLGDPVRGKPVFEKRCTGCHAMNADREGPRLAGVFERKAGAVAGFSYSAALKGSGIVWNDATLERWLSDPDVMVPKNNMDFSVPKANERRDLIAYLKQGK